MNTDNQQFAPNSIISLLPFSFQPGNLPEYPPSGHRRQLLRLLKINLKTGTPVGYICSNKRRRLETRFIHHERAKVARKITAVKKRNRPE